MRHAQASEETDLSARSAAVYEQARLETVAAAYARHDGEELLMLSWWRQRRERQHQAFRDADNLMALFGNRTYAEVLGT